MVSPLLLTQPSRLTLVALRYWRSPTGVQPDGGSPRLRLCWWHALAFPAAVLAVHQLCYLLAYGSRASSELAAHGDHYMAVAARLAAALVALAFGLGVSRLLAVRRGDSKPMLAGVPVWLVWLGATVALLAGFCALETLEIVFEPHHAGGVVGMFGHEGSWALPAAACVGALMTLLVCGGRALLAIVRRGSRTRHVRSARTRWPRAAVRAAAAAPMATCAAGRAPPSALLA